jgi:Protein of unknown function (DUF2510)
MSSRCSAWSASMRALADGLPKYEIAQVRSPFREKARRGSHCQHAAWLIAFAFEEGPAMSDLGTHPAPQKKSNVPLRAFAVVAVVGFLLAVIAGALRGFGGYVMREPLRLGPHAVWIFMAIGAFLFLVGLIGVVISVIVRAVSPSPASASPGWPVATPPGWYPDSSNPALTRYFDGRVWTASTHPRGQ